MMRFSKWNVGFRQSTWLEIIWLAFGLSFVLAALGFTYPTYRTIRKSIEEVRQIKAEFEIGYQPPRESVSSEALKEMRSSFLGMAMRLLGITILVRGFPWWAAMKLGQSVRKAFDEHGDCFCWACGFYLRAHDNLSSCPKCGRATEKSREVCVQWLNRPLWRRIVLA